MKTTILPTFFIATFLLVSSPLLAEDVESASAASQDTGSSRDAVQVPERAVSNDDGGGYKMPESSSSANADSDDYSSSSSSED